VSSFVRKKFEIGEPDLDERAHRVFEPGLPRDCERLLVRRTHLLDVHALLQTVVSGHEKLLDPGACGLRLGHEEKLARCYPRRPMVLALSIPWLQISAVFQVLVSAFLVTLVLMHSGREAGMGGLGFTPASQGGTHIVEQNLTRLTVVVAAVFGLNTILLFHLL
jgi:preprotein translocase subunit SecG